MLKMKKRKTIAGLIAVVAIVAAVIFAGCIKVATTALLDRAGM